jgi:CRP/FNR family transcriptional regulator, nitrogen fixation regulation protein
MSAHLVNLASSAAPVVFAHDPWSNVATDGRIDWNDALAATGCMLHFTQDREIYGEGDAAEVFFKVVEGVVRTCKFLSDGRRQIDAFHVAGDVFGFEAGAEYRLSAEAVCNCTLTAHRRQGIDARAANDLALSQQLFLHAMRSMARAQDHSLLLGRRSAVEKVAAFLVEWAQHSAGGETIVLAMTRQDIADYLGLTIETVSRTLSQLERDAVIEIPTARQICIKDPAALRSLNP